MSGAVCRARARRARGGGGGEGRGRHLCLGSHGVGVHRRGEAREGRARLPSTLYVLALVCGDGGRNSRLPLFNVLCPE